MPQASPSHRMLPWFAGAILIGVAPLFLAEVTLLLSMESRSYFPFVYLFIGIFAWRRLSNSGRTPGPRFDASWWPEQLWILGALAILILHGGLFGPWLGGPAMAAVLAAGILVVRRYHNVQLWDLWVLFLLTLRWPLGADGLLTGRLQVISTRLSSYLIDQLGVLHARAGNVINVPGKQLFVDEACSGIISTLTVIALGAILSAWRARTFLHTWLLLLATLVWAVVMNSIRIATIATAYTYWEIDLTSGFSHELLGLVTFSLTTACLIATDLAIAALTAPIQDLELYESNGQPTRLIQAWNYLSGFRLFPAPASAGSPPTNAALKAPVGVLAFASVLFLLVGTLHGYVLKLNYDAASVERVGVVEQMLNLPIDKVATAISPWVVQDVETQERDAISELAPFSKVYSIVDPSTGRTAALSIDFPFHRRWHNVCECYTSTGWRKLMEQTHRPWESALPNGMAFVTAEFTSEDSSHGVLAFANLYETGEVVPPPADLPNLGYVIDKLASKWHHSRQFTLRPKKLIQLQVFAHQPSDFSELDRIELQRTLVSATQMVSRELKGREPH